jgi:hypothetical protein
MEAGFLPVDVDINDPFRPLDWRFRRATQVVADGGRISPYRHDPETTVLIKFLREEKRRENRSASRAASEWWPLHEVRALAAEGGLKCAEVQALILAGLDDEAIAQRCGLAPGVVDWYEALFFHVTDRLDARDWVVYTAIGGSPLTGYPDVASIWKAFGFFHGVRGLDVAIAATTDRPLPPGITESDAQKMVYQWLRNRFQVRLAVALQQAETPGQLRSLILIRRRAETVHRFVTGEKKKPPSRLDLMERFLQDLARHPRVPTKESSVSTPAKEAGHEGTEEKRNNDLTES